MKYRTIGTDPARQREVSALALGAMWFGTATDEPTAYALLDRFVEAGGTFVDTSNNYAFWANGTQGGESEALLGRWLASSGTARQPGRRHQGRGPSAGTRPATSATSKGCHPQSSESRSTAAGSGSASSRSTSTTRTCATPARPLAEQVDGLAGLVEDGAVGMLGASNFWAWELERSRSLAGAATGLRRRAVPALLPATPDRPARARLARGHRRRRGRRRAELAAPTTPA